jgi:hypothetical protein
MTEAAEAAFSLAMFPSIIENNRHCWIVGMPLQKEE